MIGKRQHRIRRATILALGVALCAHHARCAGAKDSESASHVESAAFHSVVDTYDYPGFKVVQINLPVLSHYSYLLVSGKEVLVIDPSRDIPFYLELIGKEGLAVKGVFLTHSHADFVAGHMEMVKALKCPVYQSAKSGAQYPIEAVKEGLELKIGDARVRFVDTPGHVPDGTSAYVFGTKQQETPEVMFSGDYMFVGSVGRPDLVQDTTAEALATLIFETWHDKVSKLPDSVVVFPAHGAGSLCGAHLRDAPFTTIGIERQSNPYLQVRSKGEFIAAMLNSLSEPPQYFGHNAAMNRAGPPLVEWKAPLPTEQKPDAGLSDPGTCYLVDLRTQAEYAAGHIPNAVNIGLRGRLETWVGIMVPWGSNVVLCGSKDELAEAVFRLHRVGYAAAVIDIETWRKAGLPLRQGELVKPAALYEQMQGGQAPVIVDVRLPEEWMGLRIGTVLNLPLNHLADLSAKLTPDAPVVAVCNSAYRSSMAVGVLERRGFAKVASLDGGSEAWIQAGYPTYGTQAKAAAAVPATRDLNLPERLAAAELKRMLMDVPGTFDLVDIRPAAHFADYAIPGARNADIADVMNSPAYLTGAGPLVIVDRDGSLAMAVGGILSQKTKRPIKVLYGGVEAYWSGTEIRPARGAGPASPAGAPVPGPAAAPPSSGTPPASAPQPPRKKSAGC